LYLKIIEEKILELQNNNSLAPLSEGTSNSKKSDTKIDLDIEVFIPDDFF
jgi:transcription-repair coupling factor (superfamily II helicase)